MSAIGDVLKAVRETIVVNERVSNLSERLDALTARQERAFQDHIELRERMTRMESFFEVIRPVILHQALPPPSTQD